MRQRNEVAILLGIILQVIFSFACFYSILHGYALKPYNQPHGLRGTLQDWPVYPYLMLVIG